jgi:hypothetical protein
MIDRMDSPPMGEDKESDQAFRERFSLTDEEWEKYQQYLADNPETETSAELRDSVAEVQEVGRLLVIFEKVTPIADLYAIVDLTPAEAKEHEVRERAKNDLAEILTRIQILKAETNIAQEKYNELFAQYRYFSRAIGYIHNNKVDHTR